MKIMLSAMQAHLQMFHDLQLLRKLEVFMLLGLSAETNEVCKHQSFGICCEPLMP